MLSKVEIIEFFPLSGSKVELSIFNADDITDDYVSWLNDPSIVMYSNQRFKVHTRESSRLYLKSIAQADAIFIAIKDIQTNKMIGTMTSYLNVYHHTADIGIMLGDKSYWGQGIGRQSWKMLMDFLLYKANVRKVTGGTLSCNHGMISIMEGLGMLPDGVRISQEIVAGRSQDIIHYAAFRSGDEI